MTEENYYQELITWIAEHKPSKEKLAIHKIDLCKKHGQKKIPTDIEVLMHVPIKQLEAVKAYLITKPTRTGSGVAVVATMTAPYACPHGSCTYCPGGPNSEFGDTPKSYTGKEPSTMRGMRHDYDPYRIIFNRLEQYIVMGQNPDKVEQIIMGGTFPALPQAYQEEFTYYSFKAYNDFSDEFYKEGELQLDTFKTFFELPGKVGDESRAEKIKEKVMLLKEKNNTTNLEEEQVRNETSNIRCIGLTIETKPDWGFSKQGKEIIRLGATRVELGIQTVYDDILQAVHRGHSIEDTKKSIAELRDLGFKLNFHVMPGLPTASGERVSYEKDLASLQTIFSDEAYKPDMVKIYPCMVMPGTALKKQYDAGIFKPIETEEAANLIVEMKKIVPEWCRIMRIQRDIPTYATTAGVGSTNFRQIVHEKAQKAGVVCKCIKCREIGQDKITGTPELLVREYDASSGKEYFISMEAENKLLGFVRLRLVPRSIHEVITSKSALIRELHVYGTAVAIGEDGQEETQHKGFGKKLMAKAEEIAKEHGRNKIIVISGVGVRGYYRKIGYEREGPYMTKHL